MLELFIDFEYFRSESTYVVLPTTLVSSMRSSPDPSRPRAATRSNKLFRNINGQLKLLATEWLDSADMSCTVQLLEEGGGGREFV